MSDKVLRALVVAPTPTWPLNYGNRKRIYSVCKSLQERGYEIHYIHYASEGDWRDYVPDESRMEMQNQWEIVDHVWPSMPLHDWPKQGEDHLIDEWWDASLENHVRKTLESRSYDAVIVNYTWLSKALELVPTGTLKVLDTHDKFSNRRQLLESNGLDKEFFHTSESEELKGLNRADLVWAIKDEEKILFEKMGVTAEVDTLLHIDMRRIGEGQLSVDAGIVFGFIGANNNVNKTNLLEFFLVAQPIFNKYCPPLTVKIAGSICKELKDFGSNYFEIMGYVNSVDEFYDQIHSAITPMEFSTGLKIKVAEALSQSKAVLSHEHAFEGFPSSHKYHQCESFEELALAMCEVAYEPSLLPDLSAASIASYELIKKSIDNVLDNFHAKVISKKSVLIILPAEYGNEKKISHWLALARLDLMAWNFKGVIKVKLGHPEQAKSHDRDIRFLDVDKLNLLIKSCDFDIIFNLAEGLPEQLKLEAATVVTEAELLPHNAEQAIPIHYLPQINEVNCLPGIGHIVPPFLAPSFEKLGEFAWLIGEKETPLLAAFADLIANELQMVSLNLKHFDDIDALIVKSVVLPKKLIVLKKTNDLNRTEQALVDICTRYNVDIRFSEYFMCFDSETKGIGKSYEREFFRYWQTFITNQTFSKQHSLI